MGKRKWTIIAFLHATETYCDALKRTYLSQPACCVRMQARTVCPSVNTRVRKGGLWEWGVGATCKAGSRQDAPLLAVYMESFVPGSTHEWLQSIDICPSCPNIANVLCEPSSFFLSMLLRCIATNDCILWRARLFLYMMHQAMTHFGPSDGGISSAPPPCACSTSRINVLNTRSVHIEKGCNKTVQTKKG